MKVDKVMTLDLEHKIWFEANGKQITFEPPFQLKGPLTPEKEDELIKICQWFVDNREIKFGDPLNG
jgi:hypothetical protein